jgi:hypothetical protein
MRPHARGVTERRRGRVTATRDELDRYCALASPVSPGCHVKRHELPVVTPR